MPKSGIPKSNSIQNIHPEGNVPDREKQAPVVATGETNSADVGTSTVPDGQDVGFIDAAGSQMSSYISYPDRCSYTSRSPSWTLELGTSGSVRRNPNGSIWSDYDEIVSTNAKRWQLQAHFSEVPDPFVESCDQDPGLPYQAKVEFWANQSGSTSVNEVGLEQPEPNSQNDNPTPDDGLIGLSLDIVNSISGPYGSVASTLIEYALNANSASDLTVANDTSYSEGGTDQEQFYWELPLDGYESDSSGSNYFCDHTDNVAGVSIQVTNFTASGYTHTIDTDCQYTFEHLAYLDGDCPCSGTPLTTKQETAWQYNYNTFDSVSQ